jgi:hypothetical protein
MKPWPRKRAQQLALAGTGAAVDARQLGFGWAPTPPVLQTRAIRISERNAPMTADDKDQASITLPTQTVRATIRRDLAALIARGRAKVRQEGGKAIYEIAEADLLGIFRNYAAETIKAAKAIAQVDGNAPPASKAARR